MHVRGAVGTCVEFPDDISMCVTLCLRCHGGTVMPPYGHTLIAINLTLSVVNDSAGFQAIWRVCGSGGAPGAWFSRVLVVKVVNEFGGVQQVGSDYYHKWSLTICDGCFDTLKSSKMRS